MFEFIKNILRKLIPSRESLGSVSVGPVRCEFCLELSVTPEDCPHAFKTHAEHQSWLAKCKQDLERIENNMV